MSKVAFMTLGCKVNQADTASMQMLFREAGYEVCDFHETADVYLVNTCVVTNAGQQKSRQMIRRAIRRNPAALVVVAGCYPQTAAEEVKTIQGVDLLIGTQDRSKVVELVEEAALRKRQGVTLPREQGESEGLVVRESASLAAGKRVERRHAAPGAALAEEVIDDEVRPWAADTAFEEMAGGNEADKTRAYLKIQEGCNQYCSFCIIPYARGPLRSRSLSSIRGEVERLTRLGYEEVVLIGIHLGCYGKERADGTTLYDAVEAAMSVPGLQRLRLGSLESVEVEERLLELMAREPRLCPHLHLPLQSGCDKILREMHRPYDTARFASLLAAIRRKVPHAAVTTDVIVGFPGETEEDFQATCAFVRQCGFAKIHVFPYSTRKGTPAAARKDQVPERVKQQRAERMAALDAASQQAYFEKQVGRRVRVLAEQAVEGSHLPNTGVEGLSENYIRVEFPGEASLCGTIVTVEITGIGLDKCYGRLV